MIVVAIKEALLRTQTIPNEQVAYAIFQLEWINLWWGLINLIPVLPLDGGRISQEVCNSVNRRSGQTWALRIGIVASGAVAVYALSQRRFYIAFLFGLLCIQNVQMLESNRRGYW